MEQPEQLEEKTKIEQLEENNMKILKKETISGVEFYNIKMSHKEMVILMGCLHDILIKKSGAENQNKDKISWYSNAFSEILEHIKSGN
ncbi:hypothetical protein ID858_03380 [Xenorhabdus sp. DI]|uniref:hypothetical protein n=1 Tax=Xenorhabdus doucetiae TaxID=351671 RepID=UPI0019B3C185|nr:MULTISPECIES: hypothetical protein [unclassified Xenorhabdus]MBD2785086.1 hypothetical protein [Xenorhabdus sp. 3]MBD2787549.1 hypothetical protein [Xenorhabdus sp. DI]